MGILFVYSSGNGLSPMCGDGGNDVGALKQASVGLALLCGYGNANTSNMTNVTIDDTKGDKVCSDVGGKVFGALVVKLPANAK